MAVDSNHDLHALGASMRMFVARRRPCGLQVLAALALTGVANAVVAQSITSAPASVMPIPVNAPWAIAAAAVTALAMGVYILRGSARRRGVLSVLVFLAVVGLWGSAATWAQILVEQFTQPRGETLPIPVIPVTENGALQGFEPADFSNASGTELRIAALTPPDFNTCFSVFPTSPLTPAVGGGPPACAVGYLLAIGATCRVDVDAICKALATQATALISVSPASLSFIQNGSGTITVHVDPASPQPAQNVAASIPGGSALSVQGSTCAASLAAGATCAITFTGAVTEGPTTVNIAGSNTAAVPVTVTVTTPASTAVSKSSSPVSGAAVAPGQTISYTLTAVVSVNTTTQDVTLTDTLSANQTFGALTAPATGSCTAGATIVCTLPSGASPGTYTFTYTAMVNTTATGTVGNSVTATNPANGDPDPGCASCTTTHDVIDAKDDVEPAINSASGGTTASVLLNDTLGTSPVVLGTNATLTPGSAPTPAQGTLAMNADGTIAVASGTTPGIYTYPYTICALPTTVPAACDAAAASVTVAAPSVIAVSKLSNPASGTVVAPGQTLTYMLTAVVSSNTTTQVVTLTDTLSANQTFGALALPATGTCTSGAAIVCTLPAGTPPGTYTFTYTASVNSTATGTVGNNVTAANPVGGDPDPGCVVCATTHDVIDAKDDAYGPYSSTAGGITGSVLANDSVGSAAAMVAINVTLMPGTSPGAGLTMNADGTITIAAGTVPGTYVYPYTLCSSASAASCDTANATVLVEAPATIAITAPAQAGRVVPVPSTSGFLALTVTSNVANTSSARNITIIDKGTALNLVVDNSNCVSVAPGASCILRLTSDTPYAPATLTIGGTNTANTPTALVAFSYLGGLVFQQVSGTGKIVTDAPQEFVSTWTATQSTTGATSTTDGAANNALIIANPACSSAPGGCAAQICQNLAPQGAWYLPALNEFSAVHDALCSGSTCNFGNFSNSSHWTSTETSSVGTRLIIMPAGTIAVGGKLNTFRGRCVRAF